MSLLETLKDFIGGPDKTFQKLLLKNYFSDKKEKLNTLEEYAKWLRKIHAECGAMAFVKKNEGNTIPQKWLDGIRRIEEEIDRVKREGGSHLFPQGDGTRLSDELK